MKNFIVALTKKPVVAAQLLVSTFFITLLTLASPLFVIQVLNRYVTYGFTGTLITLTAGMLVALILQFSFRIVRTKIAAAVGEEPNTLHTQGVFETITRAKSQVFSRIPKPKLHETIGGLQTMKGAYSASTINTILDAPFALLFVAATFFLSPMLALIVLVGILFSLGSGAGAFYLSQKVSEGLKQANIGHRGQVLSALNNVETVRTFGGRKFLEGPWVKQFEKLNVFQGKDADIKEFSQSLTMALNVLMSVALYAVGAVQVVNGDLSVGGLIGSNILAGRAFSSTTRFVQTCYLLVQASNAQQELQQLFKLPKESASGTALKEYRGSLELKDLHFVYPGDSGPLFESLTLQIAPGSVVAISGFNGSGKTTLMRLITSLLAPSRGTILVDGVDLRQIAPAWWRQQISYLPQEPSFLNCSIHEAIAMADPGMDIERFNQVVTLAGLRGFLDKSPQGIETQILDNGRDLPVGIRRRIALARALATRGRLVLFDEPTEGLDEEGCRAVYEILNQCAQEKKTILVVSRDQRILKGATITIDLNSKPVPKILMG